MTKKFSKLVNKLKLVLFKEKTSQSQYILHGNFSQFKNTKTQSLITISYNFSSKKINLTLKTESLV